MANAALQLRFGPFVLDRRDMSLTRHGEPIALTPKALRLLAVLVGRAGELIAKDDLIAEVWPRESVSDTALAQRLRELRQVLGDDRRAPAFIRTEYRRGVRFVAEVTTAGPPAAGSLIGRDAAIATLDAALAAAARHERRMVFVSGEAGVGKSRLLQEFLERRQMPGVAAGVGHCIQHGDDQPYLALEDLLQDLQARDVSGMVAAALSRHAPAWCGPAPTTGTAAGPQSGAERRRRLLELCTALEQAARDRALILAIEDLHWADPSTLGFLDFLSRRAAPARLLLVLTFRDAMADLEGAELQGLVAGGGSAARAARSCACPGFPRPTFASS